LEDDVGWSVGCDERGGREHSLKQPHNYQKRRGGVGGEAQGFEKKKKQSRD